MDLIDRNDLISAEAAAVIYGVSRYTYTRLIQDGRAPQMIFRPDGYPIGTSKAAVLQMREEYLKWAKFRVKGRGRPPAHNASAAAE
jgi:hypothetical protein